MSVRRTTSEPRRQPRQGRSRATVEWIVEAAARVLERETLAGFTTNRVAEAAGISIGSLYQYFPNKDALVGELIARTQSALSASLTALVDQLDGASLDESIRAMARFAVQQQFARPALAAALDHEERRLSLATTVAESETQMATAIQRLLLRHRWDLSASLPADAARDCLILVRSLVDAHVDRGHPDDLESRVIRMLNGYLRDAIRR